MTGQQGARLRALTDTLRRVIAGQEAAIELVLTGLLAGGHVLIEDVPGVGKTTLAKALARALDLSFARVQCTPDLLPTDILGSNVLDPRDGSFAFRPGPVFTMVLLVDETNRASPRTQSGLLEAMNERQVTVDGVTRELTAPFFVIATQNPVDFQGTFPLPVAQLDRFLLRVRLGYPPETEELRVVTERRLADPLLAVTPVLDAAGLLAAQAEVRAVHVSDAVARYALALVRATRHSPDLELGISTRGALMFYRAAQAQAYLRGRDHVSPADLQTLAGPLLGHRVILSSEARYAGRDSGAVIDALVATIPVPL